MNKFRSIVVRLLSAALLILPVPLIVLNASAADAVTVSSPLALQNGWTNAPFATSNATVFNLSGIVTFSGAIATSGTNAGPFTLPASLRPATNVYVPVDLCNAANGRLIIARTGVVTVQAESAFSNAQCFTSLDGASFALTANSPLALQNGWTNAPFSTGNAAVKNIGGILHLSGAIATSGTNPVPFTLPPGFRPPNNVYVPVDLCNATNGRLFIAPTGVVIVQAQRAVPNA